MLTFKNAKKKPPSCYTEVDVRSLEAGATWVGRRGEGPEYPLETFLRVGGWFVWYVVSLTSPMDCQADSPVTKRYWDFKLVDVIAEVVDVQD